MPNTRLGGVGVSVMYFRQAADAGTWFMGEYRNMFSIGRDTATGETRTPFLSAREAYAIDLKYDDGIASTGILLGRNDPNCAVRIGGGGDAVYVLGSTDLECILRYKLNM